MLETNARITWCPGCTNFGILAAFKKALVELMKEGYKQKEFVMVTGIGCHGKIYDYVNVSSFYALHGRVLPVMNGIKLANPKLTVVGFAGDGDTFNEGIEHFVHACRYNIDTTLIVHNNQVFALTVKQPTATSELGLKTKVTPRGNYIQPINPIVLALEAGATFVARGYALHVDKLAEIIKVGIKQRGFSFIEVLQPCIAFHDVRKKIEANAYYIEPMEFEEALRVARSWNYEYDNRKIPLGIFYMKRKPTLEEAFWDSYS